MNIRSATLLCNADTPPQSMAPLIRAARDRLPRPVQSARVALPPLPDWWRDDETPDAFLARWRDAGMDYLSFGAIQLDHDVAWLAELPRFLGAAGMGFAAAEIATVDGRMDGARCRAVAQAVATASRQDARGFTNLYFSALAHCPPGAPFFPVAYHDGGPPTLALAVEAADIAVDAFATAASLDEARQRLVDAVESEAAALTAVGRALAADFDVRFGGVDFSLAPYPTPAQSLGGALEALGVPALGAPGALFAAAFVADALGRAQFARCGFSGLMLPVLEDVVLATRAGEGRLTIADLLTYAAVCGVGLDTIPLPGDTPPETVAGILLDVAALALRLKKPLTARLMPLPGLAAGDPVRFDFPFFADGAVMTVARDGLRAPIATSGPLALAPYHRP